MKTFATMVGYIFLGLLLIAAVGFLLALLISLVWNAVMPQIFNLPEITYWQAYLLYLLSYLLFHNNVSVSSSK